MCRDIARLDLPVEGAVGQEMKQFTAGHIVLGIHEIEITMACSKTIAGRLMTSGMCMEHLGVESMTQIQMLKQN